MHSVQSTWYCPIKDRDITDETKWGLGGGQWKIHCPSCGFSELAKEPYFEITETHWKCKHYYCERCTESGAGITHCYREESISTQEECDALLDTSKIWYNWRQCNHIWEKQGEWITNWVPEGCYLYEREDNGGWGSVALTQNTQITPYLKENQRLYVKFKVGQMGIHGPITDFTRLADTGIWLWMDFSEPQTVNSVEISGVELSIFLDFESANPLILPGTFSYQIRSESGEGNWLQVVWYYSKTLSGEGWIEGVIDLKPALDYIENMGVNLQQTNIYRVQALLEAHYGTAEAWYDYLDYCYWVECNTDGTGPNGLCDYRCGADLECNGKTPGTSSCGNDYMKTCSSTCDYSEEDCNNYDGGYLDDTTSPLKCSGYNYASYTSANQMRDYTCSYVSCDSCGVNFDSYITQVSVNGITSGDVTVSETDDIVVDVNIRNTGSSQQGWWYMGVEFWNVSNPSDPWGTRDFKGRINSYYNAKYGTHGCDPNPDPTVEPGNCPPGVDCSIISESVNTNGLLDVGETITVRCKAPASFYGFTDNNERIMFWIHERDLGQDTANNGNAGDNWWTDALSIREPAEVRVNIESVFCPGDLTNDDVVNILDISKVAIQFGCNLNGGIWISDLGSCSQQDCPLVDFNEDGIINILDLVHVARYYGTKCTGTTTTSTTTTSTTTSTTTISTTTIRITCKNMGGFCDRSIDCKDGFHCYCSNCLDCTEYPATCCCIPL